MYNSNPFLSKPYIEKAINLHIFSNHSMDHMSIYGLVAKLFFLLCIVFSTGVISWVASLWGYAYFLYALISLAFLSGFITAVFISRNPLYAVIGAPIYAVCQGIGLGGLSALAETAFPRLTASAIMLTFLVLSVLLLLRIFHFIRVTQWMQSIVFLGTTTLCAAYGISFIFGIWGISLPLVNGNGLLGILFSCSAIIFASFNLILDFDRIEKAYEAKLPKYMEWYFAFAILVSMVWLYWEIIRLARKLQDRK